MLPAAALAAVIGGVWAAPAMAGHVDPAGPKDAESVTCPAKFSADTKVRSIPLVSAEVIGEIPAGEWADGAWCVPFSEGGDHKTCGYYSNVWVAVNVDDTWGFAHVGCMDDYYLH